MNEALFSISVTAYALGVAVSAAAALLCLGWYYHSGRLRQDTAGIMAVLALPLGLLGARLFYCCSFLQRYLVDWDGVPGMLRLWEGGYSLWGALGGAVLAAVIAARITKQKPAALLDALAPALALFVALERFSEYFDSRLGYGVALETPFFQRFPFAVPGARGRWMLAVCALEGAAALVFFAVLLCRKRKAGDSARLFFTLYGVSQIWMESLRRDSYPRWLFVRVYQLTAAVVVAILMIAAAVKWCRIKDGNRMKAGKLIAFSVIFLLCVGIVIVMEFSIDGKILVGLPIWGAYGIMALSCVCMGAAAYQVVFAYGKPKRAEA